MRIAGLSALFLIVSANIAYGQADTYIRQITPDGGVSVQQPNTGSDVFVQQLPADAKPRVAVTRPAAPRYTKAEFIQVTETAKDPVIYPDAGLIPYDEENRPSLPLVSQGVTVLLTGPKTAASFPTIGAGAVLL
jgi:hypothetical protein